jgi:protein-L-isoaspartate O-methyltransferase
MTIASTSPRLQTDHDRVRDAQAQLLEQARAVYFETPISDATAEAFFAVPRHAFIPRYRVGGTKRWFDVGPDNLRDHLGRLYNDGGLFLLGEDTDEVISTSSQPSVVLRSLDLLQPRPGQRVFELGTGSGWNAALLAHRIRPGGHVYTVELIPELAHRAAAMLATLGITNVTVMAGDGGDGYEDGAPFDLVTFTAGTYDLPRHFYDQTKDGALLLVPIKNDGGGDTTFLLRRVSDHFESLESMPTGWISVRGKYQFERATPRDVESLPGWDSLEQREISRTPFWWGTKGLGGFVWGTGGIRCFLGIAEPRFCTFKKTTNGVEGRCFGLWDPEHESLVLAKHDCLIAYGNDVARTDLVKRLHQWVELGMPSGSSFRVHIYPADAQLRASDHQWIVRRQESQFLWTLDHEQFGSGPTTP